MHHFIHPSTTVGNQLASRCQASTLAVLASLLILGGVAYIAWASPFWGFILVAFLVVEWQARADLQASKGTSRRSTPTGGFIAMLSLIDDDYYDCDEERHDEYSFHNRRDF